MTEEKKHVGRPTNEEVANRKKKKIVKYSLITIISILLVGGIALFFNRDNIDFSSLMGASIFKSENYVVNFYSDTIPPSIGNEDPVFITFVDKLGLKEVTSCKVSNKKYADVYCNGNFVELVAKKKGTITLKIVGKNNRGKKVTKTKRIKIGKDFTPPVCKISTSTSIIRAGSSVTATVTCNENVKMSKRLSSTTNVYSNCESGNCLFELGDANTTSYYKKTEDLLVINSVKKVNNKTYKVELNFPKTNNYNLKKYYLVMQSEAFVDSSNNINVASSKTNYFKITN